MELPTLKLVMLQGPRQGEALEFQPGATIKIGRVVRGNTVQIKDNGVSSKHLTISVSNSKWVIFDLDSSNGTVLNGSDLPVLTPTNIHDGDTIKIGEFTSIQVRFEVKVNGSVRRNPRRGGNNTKGRQEEGNRYCEFGLAGKVGDGNYGDVCLGAGNGRSKRNRKLKGDGEDCDEELKNGGVENQGGRGGLRKRRVLKEKDRELELDLASEKCDTVLENVEVVKRRGRPRKAKAVTKSNAVESLNEAKGDEEEGQHGSLNVGRVTKKEKHVVIADRIADNSDFDGKELETLDKRELGVEALDAVEIAALENVELLDSRLHSSNGAEEKENMESFGVARNACKVFCRESGVKVSYAEANNKVDERELADKALEAVDKNMQSVNSQVEFNKSAEKNGNKESFDFGRGMCKELGGGSGFKGSNLEATNEVDLEKVMLGEWLSYLEVHLPKQIFDATEEMIATMRGRARQFREFVAHQQNEKGKLPIS